MLLISLLGAYDILIGYVQCARLTPSKVSFPWSIPSPPPSPPSPPTFPWATPFNIPPMAQPTFPWSTPFSVPPMPQPNPTLPTFPPFSQPTFPTFPPFPQPTFPSIPPITAPSLPSPFGLPILPGLPTGITFTFANMSQDFYPDAGVKVTWGTKITVEISIKLLVDALTKPINMIISQFKGGSNDWSMSNNAIADNNQQGFNVSATCMTLGQNGFPIKGLIIAQSPIDTLNTVVTWFTMFFDGWTLEKPFIASIDVTPNSYGAFLTNTSTMPNLNKFCTHPTGLTSIAKKQGQFILA